MQEHPAWRAAYRYPSWRIQEEREAFADYYVARSSSSERHIITNHYGDWLFTR